MKRIALVGSLVIVVMALGGSAYATPTAALRLISGNVTVTVYDDGSGDLAATTLGQIIFSGNVGSWKATVTVGTSKPLTGSAAQPFMDLGFISPAPGTAGLTILFSDIDFGPLLSPTLANAAITVTSSTGQLTYRTYWDPGNTLFARNPSYLLTSETLPVGVPYGEVVSSAYGPAGAYSLTQEIQLTNGTRRLTSIDATLEDFTTPEPSELLLTFIGLVIVCMAGLLSKA